MLQRLHEKKLNITNLLFLTKFLKVKTNLTDNTILKIILNFSFRYINFNKKRITPFLLVLELLVNQKAFLTRSRKPILYLNIRQNALVGCKLTLRKKPIYKFLDNLVVFLPYLTDDKNLMDKLNKKTKSNFIIINWNNLFKISTLQNLSLDVLTNLSGNFIFKTWFIEEKVFVLLSNNIPLT